MTINKVVNKLCEKYGREYTPTYFLADIIRTRLLFRHPITSLIHYNTTMMNVELIADRYLRMKYAREQKYNEWMIKNHPWA